MIIPAIQYILTNYSPLTSLVGDRIYPVTYPQRSGDNSDIIYPYIVYSIDEMIPINRLSGRAIADQVFTEYIIVTKNVIDAVSVSTQLRNALDRCTPGTYAGISLGRTLFSELIGPLFDDEEKVYTTTVRYDTFVNN